MKVSEILTPLTIELAHAQFEGQSLAQVKATAARYLDEGKLMSKSGLVKAHMFNARVRYAQAVYMVNLLTAIENEIADRYAGQIEPERMAA